MWAPYLEARTSAFSGRLNTAHALYQRAVRVAMSERFQEIGAQWTMEDAELHAIAGDCGGARTEIVAGLNLNRDNFTLERAARAHALCGGAEASHQLTEELRRRFPAATLTARIHRPLTAAALAAAQMDFARAIRLLEPVTPYDHAPAAEFWPAYVRGEAYLGMTEAAAASAQFQSILEHRGRAPMSPLYALAHRGAARAAALAGDRPRARALYEKFFTMWAHSEGGQLIDESRREYARLQ
jgi:hypothetical protein